MSVVHNMDAGRAIHMSAGQRGVLNGTLERFGTQQGRAVEIRTVAETNSILVLVAPADDLGHVFKIDRNGHFEDIGQTEA